VHHGTDERRVVQPTGTARVSTGKHKPVSFGARAAMREGIRQVGQAQMLFRVAANSYWIHLFQILEEYGPAVKQLSWDTFGLMPAAIAGRLADAA
jgi:hypothetical protein